MARGSHEMCLKEREAKESCETWDGIRLERGNERESVKRRAKKMGEKEKKVKREREEKCEKGRRERKKKVKEKFLGIFYY